MTQTSSGAKNPTSGGHMAPTLIEAITATATASPSAQLVIQSETRPSRATLGEVFDESRRMAAGLIGLGVRPGDIVAVQLPNWHESYVTHAAVWLAGAVLLPIVPIYGRHEVGFILKQSGARALVTSRQLRGRDTSADIAALADIPGLGHRIVVGDHLAGTIPFEELTNGDPHQPIARDTAAPSLLVYTSGTTAEPKGVQHNDAGLLGELEAMDKLRGTRTTPSTLAVFPPGHIAGVLTVLRFFVRSTPTVAMDSWSPDVATRLIAQHQLGASGGAPIHLSGILDVAERDNIDVSSLSEYVTGAAGVAGSLIRRADSRGIRAWRCYGSTEHPTISSGVAADPLHKRADTDGRTTPGTEIRLVDDDGIDVRAGREGEILTRGPELFTGYTKSEHTASNMIDGWYRTGDIGRLDADGYLTITDRKKDIIVRGGENISSKEVEDVLTAHPAVAEAAAIGSPDEKYGERVCAFVVVNPGYEFDLPQVADHFQKCGLARQKTPERIIAVRELPRTASGKVQKHRLREQLR